MKKSEQDETQQPPLAVLSAESSGCFTYHLPSRRAVSLVPVRALGRSVKNLTMNNIATKLTSLVYAGTLGATYSDSEPHKPSEVSIVSVTKRIQASEPWLLAMHGKTLSSIGDIISVRIESKKAGASNPSQPTQWSHTDVWNLIENGIISDYLSVGVALGLPPIYTIEYSDGTKVHCDACTARITLPSGQTGNVVLIQKKPNKP